MQAIKEKVRNLSFAQLESDTLGSKPGLNDYILIFKSQVKHRQELIFFRSTRDEIDKLGYWRLGRHKRHKYLECERFQKAKMTLNIFAL